MCHGEKTYRRETQPVKVEGCLECMRPLFCTSHEVFWDKHDEIRLTTWSQMDPRHTRDLQTRRLAFADMRSFSRLTVESSSLGGQLDRSIHCRGNAVCIYLLPPGFSPVRLSVSNPWFLKIRAVSGLRRSTYSGNPMRITLRNLFRTLHFVSIYMCRTP